MKRTLWMLIMMMILAWAGSARAADAPAGGDVTVAAYYFPNYHVDPRNEQQHGKGWTEWDLVKVARPRFEGHDQPRVPAWGYEDEADPAVMRKKIEVAAAHGVDAFIFDWYYYDDGPYLNRPLDEAFLKVGQDARLKFALMWANHNWIDIHPAKARDPRTQLYPGVITPATWEKMTDFIVETYFKHPAYWTIDGRAYFSVYEVDKLVAGFGGVEQTRAALDRFDEKTRAAGLKGVHLNIVFWGNPILPGESAPRDPKALAAALGAESVTSYVWIHHVPLNKFPKMPYLEVMEKSIAYWNDAEKKFGVPYYPNVTMGWDASPRTVQSDVFANLGYPFMSTLDGNTPANFKLALERARDFLAQRPANERILTINAWNEWTEGSYLEPDTKRGMGYLEAIRDVFGPAD